MKLFVKVLAFALVLAMAGPFLLPGPDGKPMYTPSEAWRSLTTRMPKVPDVLPSEPVTVYRWQDERGQWHFSGEPPPEGTSHNELIIDPDTNSVMTAPVAAESSQDDEAVDGEALGPEDARIGPFPNPEAVRQLLEDAKALQTQSLERIEAMDDAR